MSFPYALMADRNPQQDDIHPDVVRFLCALHYGRMPTYDACVWFRRGLAKLVVIDAEIEGKWATFHTFSVVPEKLRLGMKLPDDRSERTYVPLGASVARLNRQTKTGFVYSDQYINQMVEDSEVDELRRALRDAEVGWSK